jgi:hypothetical protein
MKIRFILLISILLISINPAEAKHHKPIRMASHALIYGSGIETEHYLPHPTGCPPKAFCACGAAVEVFGKAIRSLWPASAWFKFPRTFPAPGMVGVRSHHVFVLRQHIEGSIWLIADYNSGGHKSRLHQHNISGYTIVNPHGANMAMR